MIIDKYPLLLEELIILLKPYVIWLISLKIYIPISNNTHFYC